MIEEEYLPNLSEEATKISDLLHGLVFSDAIYYMKDEIFTADRLIANFSKYGERFDIFYFSGHAKDGALRFSDNFISNVDKMADVININLKNLQLGFFNACETFNLAQKIVERRVKTPGRNKLVMITCGCAINAFLAEKFATLFFNHVGRPGTYYDAYKNASTLLSLVNDKLRFREFYDYKELVNATADFDYAFIDIEVPAVIAPAAAAPAGGRSYARSIAIVEEKKTVAKPPPSIINADKKTLDILSANFVKECTETALNSNALGSKQTKILNQVLQETKNLAEGLEAGVNVKELWKKAANILPGLDSKNDFKSLVKVTKGEYDKAINQFFGKGDNNPIVESLETLVKE
jgi:hypothetical protein